MEVTSLAATHTGSVVEMVMNSGLVAKFVLLLLLFFSILSWAIIIFKFSSYKKIRTETNQFVNIFSRPKSLETVYSSAKGMRECPMARVFLAGYSEFMGQFKASSGDTIEGEDKRYFLEKIDGIARAMERSTAQEVTRLERFLFFLATTGSTSPFIGLFGTVWGIMRSFQSVGISGASNIAVVAPGIAEALIATAAGLVAAVPAVIAYNYFIHRVKVFGTEMDNFALDFLSLIEKNFGKR